MTTVSLVTVGDAALEVVEHEGAGWVSIRRTCELLGIDADSQRQKLQQKPWARLESIAAKDPAGRAQQALFIAEDCFHMWMAGLDHNRVDERVAKRLISFQCEARRVLAQHFAGSGAEQSRAVMSTARPSGGASGSGGAAVARAGGSALEQLAALEQMGQLVTGLLAVARQNAEQLAAVDARVAANEQALVAANARADDAMMLVDRISKKSVTFREDARCIKAAVAHVSRRIRSWCAYSNVHWQTVYGAARDELGLARSPVVNTSAGSGEPVKQKRPKPLGECIKRADQVLTYARVATKHGVTGCDVATINRILNGDDDSNVVDVDTQAIQ